MQTEKYISEPQFIYPTSIKFYITGIYVNLIKHIKHNTFAEYIGDT